MKRIRIVQIGTTHDHAKQTFRALMNLETVYDVIGICEPDSRYKDNLNDITFRYCRQLSLDDLLLIDDIDAVAIETEEKSLSKYALMAAHKGIAVHLDKPGGYDEKEFLELIETVRQKHSILQMGYMYRFNPNVRDCIKQVNEGKLGKIFSVEAQMSVRHDIKKREWLSQFKGGMTYFLGCHLIDLILQIMGTPDEIVPFNCCTNTENEKYCEDYGFALFKYKNGSSFIKVNAAEVNGIDRRQLVVTGTNGTIEIRPLEIIINSDINKSRKLTTYYNENNSQWVNTGTEFISEEYNRYIPMMLEFAQIIRGEIQNPYSLDYELELFHTILTCCGR